MGLNKKGIRWLADELVAHQKMYNQNTFGQFDECGTVCCLAGFCFRREIGIRAFTALAKSWNTIYAGYELCEPAGIRQLGILADPEDHSPEIFSSITDWPYDLQDEYRSNGPRWRVIAALKALQRLRDDGSIDENPKAIHTRLPQLAKLLKEQKKGTHVRQHRTDAKPETSDRRSRRVPNRPRG